jgi:hypothetical protein
MEETSNELVELHKTSRELQGNSILIWRLHKKRKELPVAKKEFPINHKELPSPFLEILIEILEVPAQKYGSSHIGKVNPPELPPT